ncbi:ABC transporter substrate-binding protein [Ramlibacter sp.]|uniref:ABC transporter substrate-binding protein n=1 Tax=Ramlibacter sp. TaxID=1917967 RepID=UPI002CCA8E51|nr:ABC transporter substrate-binding protein [Ramlibacter sp.]HWI83280.1 ABC transporter substrate-binding protein [Ramlibacter sp.]
MTRDNRRTFLQKTSAAAGAAALPMLWPAGAQAQWNNQPEKGATLRVLRWKRFVQGDEDQYLANVKKFSEKYGIEVRVDNESWEDVRPKAAVAANAGAGPDIILSTNDDANLYPDKLVDVSDVCNYLGKKYGGWYPVCEQYLKPAGKWIGVPLGCAGNAIVYRESQVKAAGFDTFPKDHAGFLKLMKALKDKGTPGGFALGHATGDQSWAHWLVWSHGGKLVNEKNQVVIDSPETIKALEYAKELYPTFVPGTLSWLDPNNNKAFLDNQVSVTANGISIYYAAKTSKDAKLQEMAKDIQHANFPIGPSGKPTEFNLFFNQMVYKYTKYPKAAKEFLRFMMEEEQYGPWMQAAIGYIGHPLKAYEANPIWTSDPKHTPYRDAMKVMLPCGYAGKMGSASAASIADFIILDMVAEAASGSKSPKEAAARAAQRAKRYYKA